MRAGRLVATLLVMQARGRVTAAELATELEVSVATARRDLEALSAAGIPVYPQAGRGGGWSLVGGARTDLDSPDPGNDDRREGQLVRTGHTDRPSRPTRRTRAGVRVPRLTGVELHHGRDNRRHRRAPVQLSRAHARVGHCLPCRPRAAAASASIGLRPGSNGYETLRRRRHGQRSWGRLATTAS